MAHRPYPNRSRAQRQIMRRHRNEAPPAPAPAIPTPAQGQAGEYRLSTRRSLPGPPAARDGNGPRP